MKLRPRPSSPALKLQARHLRQIAGELLPGKFCKYFSAHDFGDALTASVAIMVLVNIVVIRICAAEQVGDKVEAVGMNSLADLTRKFARRCISRLAWDWLPEEKRFNALRTSYCGFRSYIHLVLVYGIVGGREIASAIRGCTRRLWMSANRRRQ